MFLSLATLTHYDYNKRKLTEDDFFEICLRRGVTVLEQDVPTSFYFTVLNKEFIVINKRLTGVARQFALFHELSHCLLSAGRNGPQALFQGMCDSREEDEADAFACIALIPRSHVHDESFKDECCCGLAAKIWEKRIHLYNTYGV